MQSMYCPSNTLIIAFWSIIFRGTSKYYWIVLIHIHYQIKNSQQCPPAVAFLKFNHWCQDGFDNVSLILLAHIYCSKVQIFGWRYFYWCVYRLLQNSPLNSPRCSLLLLPCLSTMSRIRSNITSPTSFKNRCRLMWLEFITASINIRYSRTLFRFRAIKVHIRHPHARVIHSPNSSISRASRASCDHWLSLADRQSRAFGMTLLFQKFWIRRIIVPMWRTLLFYSAVSLALSNRAPCCRLRWLMTRCV